MPVARAVPSGKHPSLQQKTLVENPAPSPTRRPVTPGRTFADFGWCLCCSWAPSWVLLRGGHLTAGIVLRGACTSPGPQHTPRRGWGVRTPPRESGAPGCSVFWRLVRPSIVRGASGPFPPRLPSASLTFRQRDTKSPTRLPFLSPVGNTDNSPGEFHVRWALTSQS